MLQVLPGGKTGFADMRQSVSIAPNAVAFTYLRSASVNTWRLVITDITNDYESKRGCLRMASGQFGKPSLKPAVLHSIS